MTVTTGADVVVEVLRSEGVRHVFGNPGSTELPFMDALAACDDIDYVLALQEATAVAMADGYAQATRRPGFVNLHTSAGLGNGIGNLTNARQLGTPLVVTAGQQDRRHIVSDPLLSGDLVGLARGVSKWAHEVRTVGELGTVLRRAFHDAASTPTGPVFVSLPMDLFAETVDADGLGPQPPPPSALRRAPVPTPDVVAELSRFLLDGDPARLVIVAGDEVSSSTRGVEGLVALAEGLGVGVYGQALHATTVFPTTHPLWLGALPVYAPAIAARLTGFDRVLAVGSHPFLVYPFAPGDAVPAGVALAHLAPDPAALGRTWSTALGVVGDPGETLVAVAEAVLRVGAPGADDRSSAAAARRDAARAELERAAADGAAAAPMPPLAAVHALLSAIPPGTPVVDEAITTGGHVRALHRAERPGDYFFCKGGGLGWGMPAACGISLACDRSPVLCIVGDGSTMYSPQALWTAAHQRLPVVFAVVDNRQYLILKGFLKGLGGAAATTGRMLGMDLDDPPIDFLALARSMGVPGATVEKAADVGDAVRAALAGNGPYLLHLPIATP